MTEAHIKCDNLTPGFFLLNALVFKTDEDFNHMPGKLVICFASQ